MTFQPLTIITKRSILDIAAALDPPLELTSFNAFTILTYENFEAHYTGLL